MTYSRLRGHAGLSPCAPVGQMSALGWFLLANAHLWDICGFVLENVIKGLEMAPVLPAQVSLALCAMLSSLAMKKRVLTGGGARVVSFHERYERNATASMMGRGR